MKITLILLLLVAFATLMQLQVKVNAVNAVNATEEPSSSSSLAESNNNSSSTSIRRKRWGWFTKYFLPLFYIVVIVVLTIVAPPAAAMVSLSKLTMDLGTAYAKKDGKEALKTLVGGITSFATGGIAGTIGKVGMLVSDTISGVAAVCKRTLALTNTRSPEDNADFNLKIIDQFINRNPEENNPFKVNLQAQHPELNETVLFSNKGFECNEEFCKKHGDGIHPFGVCSPYSCSCSVDGAEGRQCHDNLIYDPMYETCDDPLKVKICGF